MFDFNKLNECEKERILFLYKNIENQFHGKKIDLEDFANDYLSICPLCGEIVYSDELDYRKTSKDELIKMCEECQRIEDECYESDYEDYLFDSIRDEKLMNGEL